MQLKEIYDFLDSISPFELQEKWDNSGLNIGSFESEIFKIYLSLDIDGELLDRVEAGSLIITHHPLIFGGLTSLDFVKYPSNLIRTMIKKDIAHIAMHTNFDKTHLNRYVFEDIFGFNVQNGSDYICKSNGNWTKDELINIIKNSMGLEHIKVINPKDNIKSIALTTGSGASMIDDINVDCFLTGDIKYHDAMKASAQNMMMIDIGHYESERFFADILYKHLEVLPILAIISNSKNPFTFIK
jgi:dinuclear metal center YbgI/SA1388 family protein